jgi:hypothetical protein
MDGLHAVPIRRLWIRTLSPEMSWFTTADAKLVVKPPPLLWI